MSKKKRMLTLLGVITVIDLIYVGTLHYKISQYSKVEPPENADYIIILGARVKGSVPSLALAGRINSAADYLKDNRNTMAIASGGKGPGEDISEAESIKRELVGKGIDEARIILEDRSTDTYENIEFSKAFIPENAKTGVVVTNNFHVYRSIMIAKGQYLDVYGLPAPTPIQAIPKSYIREYMAITKFYLKKYVLD
jgi:uncharacterized SAM-binding protein YcdF (DUF218 family)